ncbi:MAG: beta strand repeat-containing protein, partial [Anaerolineales bacterium]
AEAGGGWDPLDARDPVTPTSVSVGTVDHTLTDKSIAIQKSVTPGIVAPGSTLTYTLQFQVSDFFAFNGVVISDTFSDGQRWDNTFTPTLLLNGNAYTLTTAVIDAANVTVDVSEIGNDTDPATDGSTTVTFRISDETITRGEDGQLVGGCVDEANGSATPDCAIYNDGATTGTLVFRTVVQDTFSDTYPSGDPSVDHGDVLNNAVTLTGDVLNTATFAPTGQSESDTSGAGVSILFGALSKSVYAVNGSTVFTTPVRVRPDDTVTYRLTYSLPTSDYEDLVITDYLPLPIFAASEITVFSDTVSAAPPPAGAWKFGPSETFRALAGNGVGCPIPSVGDGTPCVTVDANSNSLAFNYGDFDDPANTDTDIDLLFTVTVSDDPFADGLFLTNQARAAEGTTNAGVQTLDGIVQIQLTEPVLTTTKGIVATSNSNNVFNPSPNAPVAFNAPGTPGARWTGVINSTNIAITAINSNVNGVDAGDLVSFAIVIRNSGTSTRGAFDVTITDTLPTGFIIPSGGLNLRVSHGDPGSVLGFTGLGGGPDSIANTADDLFGNGVVINDPGPNQGACQAHDATNGLNIVVITYDLQLDPSVTPLQGIVNTASLTNYAGAEGGPNHLPTPQTDSATTTIANIAVGKSLIATSEAHTVGTRVAVGEIVRYQLTVTLTEGTLPNVVVTDTLPNGLTFLNDGTATLAFVSNSGLITSTTLFGIGLNVIGNNSAITPTFVIPGSAITPASFSTGADPVFSLGTLLNSDSDADNEYAIIRFNALADNSATGSNDAGDNRDNAF